MRSQRRSQSIDSFRARTAFEPPNPETRSMENLGGLVKGSVSRGDQSSLAKSFFGTLPLVSGVTTAAGKSFECKYRFSRACTLIVNELR